MQIMKRITWTYKVLVHGYYHGRIQTIKYIWQKKIYLSKDFYKWVPSGPEYTDGTYKIQKMVKRDSLKSFPISIWLR